MIKKIEQREADFLAGVILSNGVCGVCNKNLSEDNKVKPETVLEHLKEHPEWKLIKF